MYEITGYSYAIIVKNVSEASSLTSRCNAASLTFGKNIKYLPGFSIQDGLKFNIMHLIVFYILLHYSYI